MSGQFQRFRRSISGLGVCLCIIAVALIQPALAQDYRLGPGDELDIAVFGDSDLTRTVTVRADGMISLPLVGEIMVVSLTPHEVGERITKALLVYLKSPKVTVTLSRARPLKIYLVGEVQRAGSFEMKPGWTVVEAISEAGGLTEKANLRKAVLIRRKTNEIIPLDLDRLILKGDQTANYPLEDGDVIQVPEFQNRVLVVGLVQNPGAFDLKEGARVLDAILAAGGPQTKAWLESVQVIRQTTGQPAVTTVNIEKVLKAGDQSQNILVHHTDIVMVPQTGRVGWADIIRYILDFTILRSLFGF